MALIDARNVVFGYGNRSIVQADRIAVDAGQCLGVFGPNGSGKTTLVRGLMGLLTPISGSVVRQPRLRVGYLPQHRSIDLEWPMSGLDAAAMALSSRRRLGWVRRSTAAIHDALRLLEVEPVATEPFRSLSGGQQQRVLLAGALAAQSELLVLDEPTEGLDVRTRQILLNALRSSSRCTGLCTILISHSVDDLVGACEQALWMHKIIDVEHPTEVQSIAVDELVERVRGARITS